MLYHILFPTVEPLLGHRPSPTLFLLWCGRSLATGSSCAWPPASGRAGLWQPQAAGTAGQGLWKTGIRCEEQLSCDEGAQMPREAVGPPSLEVFGTRMDTALSTLGAGGLQWHCGLPISYFPFPTTFLLLDSFTNLLVNVGQKQ